ncbi:MAG: hypothetical protein AAFY46_12655 [Planctomycetota bacterium]
MTTRPSRRIDGGLAGIAETVRRIAPNASPSVRSTGSAEGISVPTGTSDPQQVVPSPTVETFSARITERRLEGGGAISSDTQVIPAGTRVEYKAVLFGLGVETGWTLADNDALRQLPRYAAPIEGRCEVRRWPEDDGTVTVALVLHEVEVGVGAPCTEPTPP